MVVSAPTGQISVVLPEKMESKPGSEKVINLQCSSALIKTDHRVIHHLVLEAHTARALDAAFAVQDRSVRQAEHVFQRGSFRQA